jgi:hypothetical protein
MELGYYTSMQMLLSKAKQVLNGTKATNVPEINQIQSVLRQTKTKQQRSTVNLYRQTIITMHKGCKPYGTNSSFKTYKTKSKLVMNKQQVNSN